MKKQNFHTGLDPVSRTKNSAQPTEFDAVATGTVDKVRYAQLSSLDTGSSPVWSVVAGTDASGDDCATVVATVAAAGGGVGDGAVAAAAVTVTSPDDETVATDGGENKIVIPAGRRNPDARTASSGEAQSGTANTAGDTVTIARRRRCR